MKLATLFVVLAFTTIAMLPAHETLQGPETPGAIRFAPAVTYPAPVEYPSGIASGDFNNDGIPDLVTVGSSNGIISVALGKGDGSFGPWLYTPASNSPWVVAVGKFDGKNLDAVVGDEALNNALAMFGDGTGYFPNSMPLSTNNHLPGGIVVGDFNGDGNKDLAITGDKGQGRVFVFLGNGDGTFQQGRNFVTGGHYPTGILAGDFNGDGKLDLAVVNTAAGVSYGSVAVLLGRGNGSFDPPLLYKFTHRSPYVPSAIAMGDFNGDGKLDIAVAMSNYSTNESSYVLVLLGNGNGTFNKGTKAKAGPNPDSIAVADFNGDGIPDIVVANSPCDPDCGLPGYMSVMIGNGDGTFKSPAKFALDGEAPAQLTVADFNLDGKPDVATVNADSSTVSVLLNRTKFPTPHR
jgi:hypothetical protein